MLKIRRLVQHHGDIAVQHKQRRGRRGSDRAGKHGARRIPLVRAVN